MTTIDQLLRVKGRGFVCVEPRETVYAAISLMADEDIGSLLVMEGGTLAGIVTERHYARDVALKGRTSPQTPVRDIMETEVPCVEPWATIEACMELMTRERVRHLPVVDEGRVVGIVSIGDLVKAIIGDQQFMIEQLEHYINGEAVGH